MRRQEAPAPAYDEDAVVRRKDALFNITSTTLSSTSEWRFQTSVAWALAMISVVYGMYWMEVNFETKALSVLSYLFVSFTAVTLSKTVRDRVESEKLEKYAQGTDMYVQSHVDTLRGSAPNHLYAWGGFFVAFGAMVYCIFHLDMPSERRGYLLISGFSLLMQTFTLTKTVRDSTDGEKWQRMYTGNAFRAE